MEPIVEKKRRGRKAKNAVSSEAPTVLVEKNTKKTWKKT